LGNKIKSLTTREWSGLSLLISRYAVAVPIIKFE